MWVLQAISPTTFNVLSDLSGQVVSAILVFALGFVYPYLVWATVKRGGAVALDGVVAPPQGLADAFMRFRKGGSLWLLLGVTLILLVATLSHTAADVFLDFVTVEVGSNESYFLSSLPGGVPSYQLLEDQLVAVSNTPGIIGARVIQQSDSIAKGLSRFSILPPDPVNTTKTHLLSGLITMEKSKLVTIGVSKATARELPANLDVQCRSPSEGELQLDEVDDVTATQQPHANVFEILTAGYLAPNGTSYSEQSVAFLYMPECDYETQVPYKTIDKEKEGINGEWEVLDWSVFYLGPEYDGVDYEVFGARDSAGDLRWWINFSLNETELAYTRKNWQYGRRVRDGMSLAIGLNTDDNETHWNFYEPYLIHPEGLVFSVEYSVLTGPGEPNPFDESTYYTLSSWSKPESCPVVDAAGNLSIASYALVNASASGCIVDLQLKCDTLFAQDITNTSQRLVDETPMCVPVVMSVSLLSGVEVDPFMLAAYAGIATRNKGINVAPGRQVRRHPVALNSIAAAYVMTREIVSGTVAVEGVRARIDPGYICFMILPLLFILPLLCFKRGGSAPPVPRSIWDMVILGREEEKLVPQRQSSDSVYPPCPATVKYGIVIDENRGFDHLGLGSSFVPLERPLSQRETYADETTEHAPEQASSPKKPAHSLFPIETLEI